MTINLKRDCSKLERRFKINIYDSPSSPSNKRITAPGHPGPSAPNFKNKRRKVSPYAESKKNCQVLKHIYTFKEKKLSLVMEKAQKMKGDTGKNLVNLLEKKLVAIVFNAFAPSPAAARELISHKKVKVNGEIMKIYSSSVKVGDKISIEQETLENEHIARCVKNKESFLPSYLEKQDSGRVCILTKEPSIAEWRFKNKVNVKSVVEFFV